MDNISTGLHLQPKEFLIFTLADKKYAIDIQLIKEVKTFSTLYITSIINSPEYILGFINLHDVIIPIIDFRIYYKLSNPEYTDFTVVIIVEADNKSLGIVADSVSHIASLPEKKIMLVDNMQNILGNDLIQGIVQDESVTYILLDIKKLIASLNIGENLHVSPS